jgi:hypothetical protein
VHAYIELLDDTSWREKEVGEEAPGTKQKGYTRNEEHSRKDMKISNEPARKINNDLPDSRIRWKWPQPRPSPTHGRHAVASRLEEEVDDDEKIKNSSACNED